MMQAVPSGSRQVRSMKPLRKPCKVGKSNRSAAVVQASGRPAAARWFFRRPNSKRSKCMTKPISALRRETGRAERVVPPCSGAVAVWSAMRQTASSHSVSMPCFSNMAAMFSRCCPAGQAKSCFSRTSCRQMPAAAPRGKWKMSRGALSVSGGGRRLPADSSAGSSAGCSPSSSSGRAGPWPRWRVRPVKLVWRTKLKRRGG